MENFRALLREYADTDQALPAWVCVFDQLPVETVVRAVLRAASCTGIPAVPLCWREGMARKGLSVAGFAECVQSVARALQISVPVWIGLDHGDLDSRKNDYRLLSDAVCAGLAYVTLDMADIATDHALERACEFIDSAQQCGVCVELVVGEAGDPLTDPDTAAELARRTGADCLGVNIGTTHDGPAENLDFQRAARIARAVPVPLCIHGGSSIPDACLVAGVRQHFAKVNIGGALLAAATQTNPGQAEAAIEAAAARKIRLLQGRRE